MSFTSSSLSFYRDNSKYYGICNQRLAKTCTVNLSTFPFAMDVKVWVEVKNLLGSVRSDELLCNDALNFGMISAFALVKNLFNTPYECITSTIFCFIQLFFSETQSTIGCPSSL